MRIIWSSLASEQFEQVLSLSQASFGKQVTTRFYREIRKNDLRLAGNPYLGKVESSLKDEPYVYRSLVVHKHFKLIYRIEDEAIIIAAFFDTRRDPASLADHIK